MAERSESAVAAALAVAQMHGVRCDAPAVMRDAWHVLVHLRPAAIVARVSSALPFPQGPDPDDVVRELHVARHAARAGAPVIPPASAIDPGPHHYGGHVVTFWTYVQSRGEIDPRAAGHRLRLIHDALLDYDGPSLPRAGHPDDVSAMLASVENSADVELLRDLAGGSPTCAGQALHGDAHLDNCLLSRTGPLWHDLESACHGPREYDLAALVARDRFPGGNAPAREALAGYGSHDPELLDALIPVYLAWIYTSFLIALPGRPALAPRLAEGLDWLRKNTKRHKPDK